MQPENRITATQFLREHTPAWNAAFDALGLRPETGLLQQLVDAYAEQHRHYHTLQHLDACLRELEPAAHLAEHAAEVALALWFHDGIYRIPASDNEMRSADWARDALLRAGAAAPVALRVHALVMVTCHTAEPAHADERLLLDVDLSILGAPEARYDQYEQQVRTEYAQVPEAAFWTRRKALLQQFLSRPRIYRTDDFRDRLEARARANLQRSIDRPGADSVS